MKYFTSKAELSVCGELLPYGVKFTEVQSSFLDGLINHYDLLKGFCLCCYHHWDVKVNGDEGVVVAISEKADLTRVKGERDPASYTWPACLWPRFTFYRKAHVFEALTLPGATCNLHMSAFQDDVVLLARAVNAPCEYIMFWYDYSGHCMVGRFKTEDSLESVLEEFTKYACSEGVGCGPAREIPLHVFKGWVSW